MREKHSDGRENGVRNSLAERAGTSDEEGKRGRAARNGSGKRLVLGTDGLFSCSKEWKRHENGH